MALAKDHHISSVQTCAYNGSLMGDFSPLDPYTIDEKHKQLVFEEGESNNIKNLAMSHSSSSLGSPSSANSNEFLFPSTTYHHSHEEAHSLINFRGGYDGFMHGNGSLLSFEHSDKASSGHKDDYSTWDGNFNYNYQWHQMNNPKLSSVDYRLVEDINCLQTASNFNSISNPDQNGNHGDWLYSEGTIVIDHTIQESGTEDVNFHKRPHMGENMQALKKQCNNATKKQKPKTSASKDPQSIAAKNRRERISERLKVLQELVPNGSKVDLVTMLEKAISYVKFLQLQVKVLATDEFWPVQGGKAPDISQVKEAIDAILSSQKDRNSSSSSK